MQFVEFKTEHLMQIEPQAAQAAACAGLSDQNRLLLDELGIGVTVLDGERVIACAGFIHFFPHRAEMWSILSKYAGPHMITLTRLGQRLLAGCTYERVEATVVVDFEPGHRWLKMLGFSLEHPGLLKSGPNKETLALYSRIR